MYQEAPFLFPVYSEGVAPDSASQPLVSVVTPSFNMARYLPETLESVLSQDYPRIEMIVVDACSTDETPRILAGYRGYGDRIRVISGKDKGPSDAAHRGFSQARGEIFVWLNADDTFCRGGATAASGWSSHPATDVVYGEGWWIDDNG